MLGAESLGHHLPWYFALAIWAGWMLFVVLIIVLGRRRTLRRRTAPKLGRSNARLKGLPPGDR